jgi:hypothetical protein
MSAIAHDLIDVVDADRASLYAREARVTAPKRHRVHNVTGYLRVSRTSE